MSREAIAIIVVTVLFGQFLVLLAASLWRARGTVAREEALSIPPGGRVEPAPRWRHKPVTRREFFRQSLLASLGVFGAQFGAASVAFVWPNIRGGFGGVIDLGISPDEVRSQIRRGGEPFYLGAGRFYVVEYEGDDPEGIYEGLTDAGLMALFQRCVHLGCRVPFCRESQWFECPCHGSKYNLAGEYRDGPAPRGLDRFMVRSEEGTVRVDTSQIIQGPPRGTVTVQPDPEGSFCVTIGGEE